MSSEHEPDDRELEDFLHGRSRIGAVYREASKQDSAPPELDAVILSMAREAVATPSRRRPRWIQPMALAATLALSLGVLLNLWRDPATREQIAPSVDSRLEEPAAPSSDEAAPAAPAYEAKQKREPPVAADAAAPMPESAAPPPALKKEQTDLGRNAAPKAFGSLEAKPAPAAPPPPPAASEPAKSANEPLSQEERSAPEPLQDRAAELEPRRAEPESGMAAGAVAPQMQRKALPQEQVPESDQRAPRSAPSAPAAAAAPAARDDAAADHVEEPTLEQWIARIRARLAQGDEPGARRVMQDFRKAYPHYPLPDDLKPYDVDPTAPR